MLQPTLGCLVALKRLSKTVAPSCDFDCKAQAWQRHMVIVCKASRLEHKTLHGTYIHNIHMFSIVLLSHMS